MKQLAIDVKQLQIVLITGFIMVLFILPATASAADFEYFGISIKILNSRLIENEMALEFDNSVKHLDYSLGFDVENLKVIANFDDPECNIIDTEAGSDIICDFFNNAEDKRFIRLFFDTKDGIKKVNNQFIFSANYDLPASVNDVIIKVKLPENAALTDVFPPNPRTATANKTITLLWSEEDLVDNKINFLVKYNIPIFGEEFYILFIVTVTLIVIIVMIAMVLYVKRSPKKPETKEEPEVDTVRVVTSVLREDEKRIVDILERHDGEVIQKVLVRETDFSKAKVSRLVKNLKERGIVDAEPLGRTTKVTLKIRPFVSEKSSKEGETFSPNEAKTDSETVTKADSESNI
ncbi:MAG: MarR family transcriptional regulator [Nanoarchaeota archaeon]